MNITSVFDTVTINLTDEASVKPPGILAKSMLDATCRVEPLGIVTVCVVLAMAVTPSAFITVNSQLTVKLISMSFVSVNP